MPLLQSEIMTLGDTTFTIGCQPATVGWDLSAEVANILGSVNIPGTVVASDLSSLIAAMRALMGVPAPQLKRVRNALFEYVEFSNSRAATPQKLAGAEEMAFNAAGLSSIDIWKVFAAAFRVNFSEYWDMISGLIPALSDITLSTPTESPNP